MTSSDNTSSTNSQISAARSLTLTDDELLTLNHSFTQAGIKWLAMLKGMWASVLEVNQGQITLEIIYPVSHPTFDKTEVILKILSSCRAFTYHDAIRCVYVLEYKDNGAAGQMVMETKDGKPVRLFDTQADYRPSFGDTKQLMRDRVYSKEEFDSILKS